MRPNDCRHTLRALNLCLAMAGGSVAVRAQVPWHPSVGVAAGVTTLQWAWNVEIGAHADAELAIPFGRYFGLRVTHAIAPVASADSSMHGQLVTSTEIIARARLAAWNGYALFIEGGPARVHVSANADWVNTNGDLQRMRVERRGAEYSLGAAVVREMTSRITVEARVRRTGGSLSDLYVDGGKQAGYAGNTLTAYRAEVAVMWRPW